MNVKELILSHPAAGIAAALVDRLKSSTTPSVKRRNWTNSRTAGGIAAPAVGKKRPFSMPIVFFNKL